MTDHETVTEATEQPAPLAATSADAVSALQALIALITDPQRCAAKLKSLQEHESAALKAEASLAHAKKAHDEQIAKERKEIASEMAALVRRRTALTTAEREFEETKQRVLREKAAQDRRRYRHMGNGMVQDLGPDPLDEPPVEGAEPSDPHFENPDPWFVPSPPASVSKEPERRARPRRQAEL
jgi:hypothetical protein